MNTSPEDPAASETFNRAMGGRAGARAAAAVQHAWGTHSSVVDIGGGNGSLIIAVLTAHKHLRGIVFDMPHVAAAAQAVIESAELSGRCELVRGDFFVEPIPPADGQRTGAGTTA